MNPLFAAEYFVTSFLTSYLLMDLFRQNMLLFSCFMTVVMGSPDPVSTYACELSDISNCSVQSLQSVVFKEVLFFVFSLQNLRIFSFLIVHHLNYAA